VLDDDPLMSLLRSGDMALAVAMVEADATGAARDGFVFPPALLSVMGGCDPTAVADCIEEMHATGIAAAAVATPTLLIAGELEDPDDEAAVLASRLQHGERLRLPQLGHAGAGAASTLTVPTVRAFLDRWMSPSNTG
jgi:hypothetical protein